MKLHDRGATIIIQDLDPEFPEHLTERLELAKLSAGPATEMAEFFKWYSTECKKYDIVYPERGVPEDYVHLRWLLGRGVDVRPAAKEFLRMESENLKTNGHHMRWLRYFLPEVLAHLKTIVYEEVDD